MISQLIYSALGAIVAVLAMVAATGFLMLPYLVAHFLGATGGFSTAIEILWVVTIVVVLVHEV